MSKGKVVVVSGATGDLGKAYLEHYSTLPETTCYGLSRRENHKRISSVNYLLADLTNEDHTKSSVKQIFLENAIEILFIHPVGMFKFEENGSPKVDKNKDCIDDEVFRANIETFYNIARPLIDRKGESTSMKLVAFGSLSDPYNVPWWSSYSKAKNILRKELETLTRKVKGIHGIFINLSSVKTSNEMKTRPLADMKYWITPREVVQKTIKIIECPNADYVEADVFNPSPEYHFRYYEDHKALREKWIREMGIS